MKIPLVIAVRSTEIDAYGHVNNAKYLEYIEWGRFEWFKGNDLSLNLFGGNLSAAVVNVNINYRRESLLGEALRIDTRLTHLGGSSFKFGQEITGVDDGVVRADAVVTGVAYDPAQRRACQIPSEVRESLLRLVMP